MTTVATSASVAATTAPQPSALARVMSNRMFEPVVVVIVLGLALFAIPGFFDSFWVANFTQMAVYSIVAASAGLLYGRVGLVSLGQVAAYGIGCWVTMRLAFATTLPFPVLLIIGGLAPAVIGVFIRLPPPRVSGLYLALVTLIVAPRL